jgi:putative FmdB family regulatory protein
MPMYEHKCDCGAIFSEFRPLARWNNLPTCPECGKLMPFCYGQQSVRGSYKKPIRLESMGFLAAPEDVAEHRKRFPDVELAFEDGSAIPILRSLGQKRKYFKAAGLVDTRSF